MKLLFQVISLAAGLTLAAAVCQYRLGRRQNGDALLHTMRISLDPVEQPMNMSLLFDYLVDPVDIYLQITRVEIATTSVGVDNPRCSASWPITPALPNGFRITISSLQPVLQMFGSAEVYGIRRFVVEN